MSVSEFALAYLYGNGDKKARRKSTPGKINMVLVRGSAQDRVRELGRLRVQRHREAKKKIPD